MFAAYSHFHPSLMYADEAGAYPYKTAALITAVKKSFMIKVPGLHWLFYNSIMESQKGARYIIAKMKMNALSFWRQML